MAERDVVLAAVRQLEPYQRARLEQSEIRTVPGRVDANDLQAQLDALRDSVARVYLHIDLNSLDTSVGCANEHAAPGGPPVDTLVRAIGAVFKRFIVEAAAITAYDPRLDSEGHVLDAARRVGAAIGQGVAAQARLRSP